MNESKTTLARIAAQSKFDMGYRPNTLMTRVNTKILKSQKKGVLTYGLSLAPSNISGFNMCAYASPECKKFCLFSSGHASEFMHGPDEQYSRIWESRIVKTLYFKQDRTRFMNHLVFELYSGRLKAAMQDQDFAVRLNLFSDVPWENEPVYVKPRVADRMGIAPGEYENIMEVFPDIQFYDYNSIPHRMFRPRPNNYHLTFSLKENNLNDALEVLQTGGNVAAVVDYDTFPASFMGYPTVNGDEHDLRYLDPMSHIVILKPKGALVKEDSPFKNIIRIKEVA